MELAENNLLTVILQTRKNDVVDAWRQSSDVDTREQLWHAQRQITELVGAIQDAIREYSGS